MQQSKAYVIKTATRNLKATIAARKAEYVAYRYGTPNARGITPERCKHPPCREPDYCGWAAYCGATD